MTKLNMQENPALVRGTQVSSVVIVAIALLQAFGVEVTEDQERAVLEAAIVVLPLVTAWLIRGHVWSPRSHDEALKRKR